MKVMKLPKELQPFLESAEAAPEETLVFIEEKRPVAAFISLRKADRAFLPLGADSEFLRIIKTARKEIRSGQKTSLEVLERKFEVATPNKALNRTRKKQRAS